MGVWNYLSSPSRHVELWFAGVNGRDVEMLDDADRGRRFAAEVVAANQRALGS
jgi:hypothetical protein